MNNSSADYIDNKYAQQTLNNSYNQKQMKVERTYMNAFRGGAYSYEPMSESKERTFNEMRTTSVYPQQKISRFIVES